MNYALRLACGARRKHNLKRIVLLQIIEGARRVRRQCLCNQVESNTRAAGRQRTQLLIITDDKLRRHLSFNEPHEHLRACNIDRNSKHATHTPTEESSYPRASVLTPHENSIALCESVIHQ